MKKSKMYLIASLALLYIAVVAKVLIISFVAK